jgi:hypothetical protein
MKQINSLQRRVNILWIYTCALFTKATCRCTVNGAGIFRPNNICPAAHRIFSCGKAACNLLAWYVIEVDRQPCGTLWFEKENRLTTTATLGIMLGNAACFGKGIGRQAILMGIGLAAKELTLTTITLNVRKSNARAIACYTQCGFQTVREGIKTVDGQGSFHFLEMHFSI